MTIEHPADVIGLVAARIDDLKRLASEDSKHFREAIVTMMMLQEYVTDLQCIKEWASLVRNNASKEYCETYGETCFELFKKNAVWEVEHLERLLSKGPE